MAGTSHGLGNQIPKSVPYGKALPESIANAKAASHTDLEVSWASGSLDQWVLQLRSPT